MRQHAITKIDCLKIDVEGGELEVSSACDRVPAGILRRMMRRIAACGSARSPQQEIALRHALQVLRGIDAEDWRKIQRVVMEAHSAELRNGAVGELEKHFDRVFVTTDARLEGSQLCCVNAYR